MNGEAGKGSKRRPEDAKKIRENLGKIDWGREMTERGKDLTRNADMWKRLREEGVNDGLV